jgi:hypothetical protein
MSTILQQIFSVAFSSTKLNKTEQDGRPAVAIAATLNKMAGQQLLLPQT